MSGRMRAIDCSGRPPRVHERGFTCLPGLGLRRIEHQDVGEAAVLQHAAVARICTGNVPGRRSLSSDMQCSRCRHTATFDHEFDSCITRRHTALLGDRSPRPAPMQRQDPAYGAGTVGWPMQFASIPGCTGRRGWMSKCAPLAYPGKPAGRPQEGGNRGAGRGKGRANELRFAARVA